MKVKRIPSGACKPVSADEKDRFIAMYRAGASYKELEEEFGVAPYNRVTKWGLTRTRDCLKWQKAWDTRRFKKWTEKEDAALLELWRDRAPIKDLEEILKRSHHCITQRARAIGAIKPGHRTCIDCRRQYQNFTPKQKLCDSCREIRRPAIVARLDAHPGWANNICEDK